MAVGRVRSGKKAHQFAIGVSNATIAKFPTSRPDHHV